jgi:hypothetical protein
MIGRSTGSSSRLDVPALRLTLCRHCHELDQTSAILSWVNAGDSGEQSPIVIHSRTDLGRRAGIREHRVVPDHEWFDLRGSMPIDPLLGGLITSAPLSEAP